MKYKNILFTIILLLCSFYNYLLAQNPLENSSDYKTFYTYHKVKLPVITINNKMFLHDIDSLVLSHKLHLRKGFEDHIYSIQVKEDSLKRRSVIYINFVYNFYLEKADIYYNGIFKRNGTFFIYFGDNPDNLYTYSGFNEEIEYKREDCLINGKIIENWGKQFFYDFPTWAFFYQNGKLKLHSVSLSPKEDEVE